MPIDIKTAILHCKSLKERKQNVLLQMDKFGFSDYFFYEDFDGCELNTEIIDQYCVQKQNDWKGTETKLSVFSSIIDVGRHTQRELNLAEISLTIKFGKVFQQLSQINADYFIVFEDDIMLCDDFDVRLPEYLSRTPDDWDVIYFGSGASLKPKNMSLDKIAYKVDHPASRCLDSILVKKNAVCQLARTWFPFHLISDWEIAYHHKLHNHNVYWWEPSLVKQGSEHGIFKSTLR